MTSPKPLACVTLLCLCLSATFCVAQDKAKNTFGKVSPADFNLPSKSIIDSNASAVILSDVGDVHFVGNKEGWFSYVYKRQTRIKILNKKAFALATVSIDLYGEKGGDDETLSKVEANAFNLENGQVAVTALDPKDIFLNRTEKKWTEAKFSVPGLKAGSVIEYTYTITSAYNERLPSWEFQWENYPCLESEYQVDIPQTLSYVLVRQGVHPYVVDKGSTGHASYRVTDKVESGIASADNDLIVSANTIKHTWLMKDIPAFGSERYLTTPKNYIDKINFQLSSVYNGEVSTDHMNSWAQATTQLLTRDNFGGAIGEDNSWLEETLGRITAGSSDQLQEARSIYYYVASHFTCTNYYNPYIKTTLRDAVKANSGTVGDINLLLIAMLRNKGLHADPVLLSTREFGFNMVKYPILEKLNYVIARVNVGGRIYYLDAAHSQLKFGQLAENCYNGHARIISNTDSASVYFEADSLKESKVTMVLIANTDKGLEGSWQSTLGPEESYKLRRTVGDRGEKDYFKDIQTSYGDDLTVNNGGIDSLDRLEDPVKVHYDFQLREPVGSPILYFNPIMGDAWRENPFAAAERKYPVEMPYVMDQTYVFSMEIPPGYVVDEIPKSAKVALNGDQGYFEYLVVQSASQIQLRCRVRLSKAWFPAQDYVNLRDFFAYVVKKQSEQIVLKKQ
jgi:hypothetical protein